jgi:hypothetical protein
MGLVRNTAHYHTNAFTLLVKMILCSKFRDRSPRRAATPEPWKKSPEVNRLMKTADGGRYEPKMEILILLSDESHPDAHLNFVTALRDALPHQSPGREPRAFLPNTSFNQPKLSRAFFHPPKLSKERSYQTHHSSNSSKSSREVIIRSLQQLSQSLWAHR